MLRQFLIASFLVYAGAQAATIRVPGDQPTIQAGIVAAAEGDTVLVAPGTYTGEGNKNLVFGGVDRVLLSAAGAEATIIDCEGDGRGLYFHNGETNAAVVEGFTIRNGNAHHGGGISCWDSAPTITNCTISENSADDGGGLCCVDSSPTITNCTISENSAAGEGGGLYCWGSSSPTITNCILWGDHPEEITLIGRSPTPTLTYCNIEGGWSGEGNFDLDPVFVDAENGDYHLNTGSPCIDAGTAAGAPDTDFEGDPRPMGGGFDIGADESEAVGIAGSTPVGLPTRTKLAPPHPNPFNPQTLIPFELAKSGVVRLTVYDLRGALVRTLLDTQLQPGSHAVRWDGTSETGVGVVTGVYIVQLEMDRERETQKVVLVK